MKQITSRVPDDAHEEIEDRADDTGASKSEVVRDLISKGLQYEDDIAELEGRIQELEDERKRLERQLEATNKRVDEHQELVEYVESEKQLQTQEHERRQEWRKASAVQKAKWWLLGQGDDVEEDPD